MKLLLAVCLFGLTVAGDIKQGDPDVTPISRCNSGEFSCRSGDVHCIPLMWRCDCAYDCQDGSDEEDCSVNCLTTSAETSSTTSAPQNRCKEGWEPCSDGEICIPGLLLCDGHNDCPDGSDEQGCPVSYTCAENFYFCKDKRDPQCLHRDFVCNGNKDCSDGSDESLCDRCPMSFCQNGGTCYLENHVPVCRCKPNYAQNRCVRTIANAEKKIEHGIAAPEVDESVSAFLQGAANAGSLSEALGIEDTVLQQLTDDIEKEMGKTVKEAFEDLLEKIRENVENGKSVGKDLLEKVKELRQKMKDLGLDINDKSKETLQKVREKAKETLKKILERLGVGKRNIDDSMDQIARLYFRDIIESIKEKLTSEEAIRKIRDYVNSLEDTPLTREIKEFLSEVKDGRLREVLGHLLQYRYGHLDKRAMGETWDKIKGVFKDLNVDIQQHGKNFGDWLQSVWEKGLDQLRQKYGAVKAIAMEYISNTKDVSAETAQEALEFFRQYKDELGTLWKQIVDATKEAIGKF